MPRLSIEVLEQIRSFTPRLHSALSRDGVCAPVQRPRRQELLLPAGRPRASPAAEGKGGQLGAGSPAGPGQRSGGQSSALRLLARPRPTPEPLNIDSSGPGRGQRPLPASESVPSPLRRCRTPAGRDWRDGTPTPIPCRQPRRGARCRGAAPPNAPLRPPVPGWRSTLGSCPRPSAATAPHRRGHPPLSPAPPRAAPRWRGGSAPVPGAAAGGVGGTGRWEHGRPRAGAGRAAQGHGVEGGGASRRLRRARCGEGTAGGLRAPSPPPCPPPGPHSPCCGGGCGLSRRLCAAGLGAELRLLQSPPQRSLIGGRGLVAPRPLIWVHSHAGRVSPLRGPREPGGVLPAVQEPRGAGPEAARPSLPGGRRGAWGPALGGDRQC